MRLTRTVLRPTRAGSRRRTSRRSRAATSPPSSPSDACRSRSSSAEGLRAVEGEVGLEPVEAALAAEARLLVAAERARRVEAVERVRPHDAGAQPLRHPEDARSLLRPDAGAQAVRGVVRLLHRLLRRPEREHAQDRPEDLLLGDPVALRDVREDGRREPVALLGEPAGWLVDLGALFLAGGDELLDLLELHPRV